MSKQDLFVVGLLYLLAMVMGIAALMLLCHECRDVAVAVVVGLMALVVSIVARLLEEVLGGDW